MKLWTIQTLDAWQSLRQAGYLRAELRYADQDQARPYQWMIEQARRRIGPAPAGCEALMWAWYQWQDQQKPKPDLRFRAHLPTGTAGVRLEIEIEDSRVLLSDFELWHYVLNHWYVPASEVDDAAFKAELALSNPTYDERIRRSWLRIFDLDWSDEYVTHPRAQKTIQAVFWELRLDQVRHVQHFTAR